MCGGGGGGGGCVYTEHGGRRGAIGGGSFVASFRVSKFISFNGILAKRYFPVIQCFGELA
jgi:hypothetical protein